MPIRLMLSVFLCSVSLSLTSCSGGSGSEYEPKNFLFITDSLGAGTTSLTGYVEFLTIQYVYESTLPAFGTPEILDHMEEFQLDMMDFDIDAVWINAGLWDAVNSFTPITSFEEYASNLEQIFQWLLNLGVQVYWCETASTRFGNVNEKVFEFNVIANGLAQDYGITVFEMSYWQQVYDWELAYDGLHFRPDTAELVAMEIEAFLRSQ